MAQEPRELLPPLDGGMYAQGFQSDQRPVEQVRIGPAGIGIEPAFSKKIGDISQAPLINALERFADCRIIAAPVANGRLYLNAAISFRLSSR